MKISAGRSPRPQVGALVMAGPLVLLQALEHYSEPAGVCQLEGAKYAAPECAASHLHNTCITLAHPQKITSPYRHHQALPPCPDDPGSRLRHRLRLTHPLRCSLVAPAFPTSVVRLAQGQCKVPAAREPVEKIIADLTEHRFARALAVSQLSRFASEQFASFR